jgi:hypothetical protein
MVEDDLLAVLASDKSFRNAPGRRQVLTLPFASSLLLEPCFDLSAPSDTSQQNVQEIRQSFLVSKTPQQPIA